MRRVLALLFVFIASPTLSQTDFAPGSLALLDRLESEFVTAGEGAPERYGAYLNVAADMKAAAATDPVMPLATALTEAEVASDVQVHALTEAVDWARLGTGPMETQLAVTNYLLAAYYTPEATPLTRKQLYELGEALDKLNAAGMVPTDIQGLPSPGILKFIEEALKVYKAGLSAAELAGGEEPERARIVRDLLDLVPAELAPALNGPAGAAFADLLEWNGEMFDASTDGIDVVADAIARGELDQERYAAVAEKLERLATEGPWDSDTAREFLKKWGENLPGVGKLIKAVWPEPMPEECKPINCDCDSVDWGILTGAYQEECRAAEAGLIKQCRESKAVAGTCHPTASGPAAFPM